MSVYAHNYVTFSDRAGKVRGTTEEKNGWLLLEAILAWHFGGDDSLFARYGLAAFARPSGTAGWWPDEVMRSGCYYPLLGERVFLVDDIDDTAWWAHLQGRRLSPDTLRRFVTTTHAEMPERWLHACRGAGVEPAYVLRTWADRLDWAEDLDLVGIAAALANTDDAAAASSIVEHNIRLLNHAITQTAPGEFIHYYEPVAVGYMMILFWDTFGRTFLSRPARQVLCRRLAASLSSVDLAQVHLCARWGGGSHWYGSYMINTYNARVCTLLVPFMKKLCATAGATHA